MDMDEWYSEANVGAALQAVMSFQTNLRVSQELLDMLKFWDTDGSFAEMGLVFDLNSDDFNFDNLYKAIAYSWIYIQNTEPEMTADQFLSMLNNAADWNGFYEAIYNLGVNVMGSQYNLDSDAANEMVKKQWAMIMEMMENFPKFIGSNIDFEKWGQADWANWLEKLRQLSPNTDNIDFNEMQAAFMDFFMNQDDISKFTVIVNWYNKYYAENNPMPQKPHYLFGLANCMRYVFPLSLLIDLIRWRLFRVFESPLTAILHHT